jgi:uncharacterized membrane protein YbhN (UPF0104 family)
MQANAWRRRTVAKNFGRKGIVKKQLVVILLKYGLGLGLLVYVIWSNWDSKPDNPGLSEALQKPIDPGPLLLAVAVYLVAILITFYRWYVLVRAQDLPFTVAAAMRLGLIGFYLSTFLPGSVGGDIIKAAFIAKAQRRRTVAVATVLVDRFIGLCGLFWLVALVGSVAWLGGFMHDVTKDGTGIKDLQTITLAALGATVGSFAVWFIAGFLAETRAESFARGLERVPKIGKSLAELWRALYMYRRRGQSVAAALLMSVVGHVGFVLAFYFSAQTLTPVDKIPSLAAHFLLVPVGMAIAAGFPAPGGVGGSEFGFGMLYQLAGYPAANGVLGSLVQRVITWTLGLIGYLVYLRMKPSLQPLAKEMPPVDEPAATRG